MNFLSANDISKEEINRIFDIADTFVAGKQTASIKEHSVLAMYFEKPSTRTRLSFEVGMTQLGGRAIFIDSRTTQLSRGETYADTARMLSNYCDFIAARLNKHTDLIEMANNSDVPVINALTDLEHPTQGLADLYTIRSHVKSLKDTRIAFMGDLQNNTFNSLMVLAAKEGAEIFLVGPQGYLPKAKYVTKVKEYSKVVATNSLEDGLENADVVYTDTFISMGQEGEAEKRRKMFAPYQLNQKALDMAGKKAIVMHPLPAHRGEEITSDVLDGSRSVAIEQARNKLLLNKALVLYLSQH
ncbi:MAG: ornithine carbamoyltransferase [Candidatus Micrarchaeales archaeon]|nr:ornithine carbamoyltransferase [Candidatus Micrarchaeales archaeon]